MLNRRAPADGRPRCSRRTRCRAHRTPASVADDELTVHTRGAPVMVSCCDWFAVTFATAPCQFVEGRQASTGDVHAATPERQARFTTSQRAWPYRSRQPGIPIPLEPSRTCIGGEHAAPGRVEHAAGDNRRPRQSISGPMPRRSARSAGASFARRAGRPRAVRPLLCLVMRLRRGGASRRIEAEPR